MKLSKKLLSLALAGMLALPGIALAKENPYMDQPIILEPVKVKDEYSIETYGDYFTEPSFVECEDTDYYAEYAYVDDSGNIISWFPAKKETIDGLHWTPKSRKIEDYNPKKYDDKISEPHAHLYFCEYDQLIYPIYSEDDILEKDGVKYYKFPEVRFLSPEKCKILLNSGLTRVVDNYDLIKYANSEANEILKNCAFMRPIYVGDDSVVCTFTFTDPDKLSCYEERSSLMISGVMLVKDSSKKIMQEQYPAVCFQTLDTASLQTAYPSFMLTK